MNLRRWISSATDLLLPRKCPVCHSALHEGEQWVCRGCLANLPVTGFEQIPFNAMEQLFAGKTPIERAAAYFYYEKHSPYASLLHQIKYHNQPQLGRWLAARAAQQMQPWGLFQGIDCLVPVPLHFTKLARRGYNQSDHIARGLSDVTGLPVYQAIVARRAHDTQTRKSAFERYRNSQGLYVPRPEAPGELAGKGIMLIDDVVTTGATLLTCAEAMAAAVTGVRISLFTLAAARLTS